MRERKWRQILETKRRKDPRHSFASRRIGSVEKQKRARERLAADVATWEVAERGGQESRLRNFGT